MWTRMRSRQRGYLIFKHVQQPDVEDDFVGLGNDLRKVSLFE